MDVSNYNPIHYQYFHEEGIYPIKPFHEKTNPLNKKVESDHAEIGISLPDLPINIHSWNIRNAISHDEFEHGTAPPFKDTHLFVKEPFKDSNWDPALLAKMNNQISVIANRLTQSEVDVQVITQGSEAFFNRLFAELKRQGKNYKIAVENKPEEWTSYRNMTAVLYNEQSFKIKNSEIISLKYAEAAASGKLQEIYVPYIHLQHKKNIELVILGVHLPASDSFYPKTGLEKIAELITKLYLNKFGKADIIAIGDFNTTPAHAKEVLLKRINIPCCLIEPSYLTHVNSNSMAAKCDFAIVAGWRNNIGLYRPLPLSKMSEASQAFVSSIESSLGYKVAESSLGE
jgi:hypothetical protein